MLYIRGQTNRSIKVMARGLHATCTKEKIMKELQQNGLKILDAVNIIKKERKRDEQGNQVISKRGLPLFVLTFDNQENVENIYNIRAIFSMKVKN